MIVEAVKVIVLPAHTGDDAVGTGATGIGFTVTIVVPAGPVHPLTVADTLYVPVAAVVADGMEGFWDDDEKPLGPVHE